MEDANTFHLTQCLSIRVSHSLGLQIPTQDPEAWYDIVYRKTPPRSAPKYAGCRVEGDWL